MERSQDGKEEIDALSSPRSPPRPRDALGEDEVLFHREVGKNPVCVGNVTDPGPGDLKGLPSRQLILPEADTACARWSQAHNAAQCGGLARAVSAQEGDHFPLAHPQGQTVDDHTSTVTGDKVMDLEDHPTHSSPR